MIIRLPALRAGAFFATGACAVLSACHRQATPAAAPTPRVAAAADSTRGTILVTGADPQTVVVLRTPGGAACSLKGDAAALHAAAGLDVVVWGTRDDAGAAPMPAGGWCALAVQEFAVRGSAGLAATDGILRADGAGFALDVTRGARVPLANVPASLRPSIGARIFWVGPLDRAPAAYGVLSPPR
jgi:hypothetical protein